MDRAGTSSTAASTAADSRTEFRRRIVGSAAIWLVTLACVGLAIKWHDLNVASWRIALDVAVGLTFVGAGFKSPGREQMRALIVAVGWAWLLASLPGLPASWHQAILAVSLLLFPSGRVSRTNHWVFIALTVPFALGFSSQPAMALYFLVVGVVVLATTPGRPSWVWFPTVSSLAMALVLGGLWFAARLDPNDFDPTTGLLFYQLVLTSVAIGYAIASRTAARFPSRFTDTLLGEGEPTGIDALRTVLADTLHDDNLQILIGQDEDSAFEISSRRNWGQARQNRFEVTDSGHALAIVLYSNTSLDDENVRESVAIAIRMTLTNARLIDELDDQTHALAAARSRLMAAVDEVRENTWTRLRGDVVVRLDRAVDRLRRTAGNFDDTEASSALSVALAELKAANSDIRSLLVGLRPPGLSRGGLVHAIGDLVARSPIPIATRLPEEMDLDADIETTLYYVVSEAITNATKHSEASRIEVSVMEKAGEILLTVTDDGHGGADPGGSGLLGLADRVAARGGRLRVESPPGAGTTVTALIANRSSSTA